MVKSKTKSVSNQGAFSIFSKTERSIYNFLKFLHEIEAATAICFVIERGRRKSQQNFRIHERACTEKTGLSGMKLVLLIQIAA